MISARRRFSALILTSASLILTFRPSLGQEDGRPLDRVEEHLNALETIGFSGFVLIARDGRVVVQRACGLADRSQGTPYTGGTVSTIGSITKQFTAAAVVHLAENGRLALDATLGELLGEVPADKAEITVHQLLTHTSGLPELPRRDRDPLARDQMLAEGLETELLFPPGRDYRYSNLGYSVLAALVERVTEEPYEVFLRRELLVPAGLFETGYVLPEHPPARLAHGYRGGEDQGTFLRMFTTERGPGWVLHGNGGILSTPYDMLRWHLALERGAHSRTLAPKLWKLPPGSVSRYGYGWSFRRGPGGRQRIQHNGGNLVFYADYHYYPDSKWFLFLMTNVAELGFEETLDTLGRGLFGEEIFGLPGVRELDLDEEARRAWTGRYESDADGRLTVFPRGQALGVRIAGQDLIDRVTGAGKAERAVHRERNRQAEETFARALSTIIERNGPLRSHRILGTTAAWFHAGSELATWIELDLAAGPLIRRLHWDAQGELVGLGGSVYPTPVTLWAVPAEEGSLQAFHLERRLPDILLRLDPANDRLSLAVGGESVSMTRR